MHIKRILFYLIIIPQLLYSTEFKKKITHLLKAEILKNASIGIEILELKTNKTIYSKNSKKLLIPASGVKIITALAGLSILKPNYKFKTKVFCDSLNLYIKGYGDPTLCTHDLEEVSNKIVEYGIKEVENIVYDDSYFDEKQIAEGWIEEENAYGFNARISALSLNRNCVVIFVQPGKEFGDSVKFILYPDTKFIKIINLATTGYKDSLFVERKFIRDTNCIILKGIISKWTKGKHFVRHIDNPSLYTATVFKEILQKKGIKVKGELIHGKVNSSCKLIYSHFSSPLLHILYFMNKESINFYADQILKAIGAKFLEPPGSFKKGRLGIQNFLTTIGLKKSEFKIYDGSGLSRYNLISAKGIVKILLNAWSKFEIQPEFLSSLPISGTNGTLKKRLKGIHFCEKVRAKTGTMMGINSLSGYIKTKKGSMIAFSIIINNFTSPSYEIKKIQDDVIKLIINEL